MKGIILSLLIAVQAPLGPPHRVITFAGVGPIRIGATVAAASKKAGEPLKASVETPEATEECGHVELASNPHIWFMVERGRITRLETGSPLFRTASGIRVGDSEERVRRAYGARLEIEPHVYVDGGHYFIVRSADRRFALVLESDGKEVFNIRAGLVPWAEYVEGCL